MSDHTENPDYALDAVLELTRPEQLHAMSGGARPRILSLLGQRAATTKQIAESLGLPKGTVGHHLKVLEAAGLIRVARTRQVRAITEKYYGRVARTFRLSAEDGAPGEALRPLAQTAHARLLHQAAGELLPPQDGDDPSMCLLVHARLFPHRAHEFARRLEMLAREFTEEPDAAGPMYGLVAGIYLANWPNPPLGEGDGAADDDTTASGLSQTPAADSE